MDLTIMTNEEIEDDREILILTFRCLKLLEYINNSHHKTKEDIVNNYVEILREEDINYSSEFKMFEDTIKQHITNTLVLLEELDLIVLYEKEWNLTTKGLDFYKDKSELLANELH